MIINHNLSAMYSHRQFKINTMHTQKNIEKLASGMRINRAGDDAAGLAVSEKMRAQIRGLHQASRNAQDGISFVQTAEGYLNETQAALQRMRELAVQAANGIYTYEDRMQIKTEIEQLVDEIDRIASHAEFNTLKLLRGGFRREPKNENYNKGINEAFPYDPALVQKQAEAPVRPIGATDPQADPDENEHALVRSTQVSADDPGGIYFHVGANMDQREKVYIENMSAVALGLAKSGGATEASQRPLLVSYLTQDGANRAIAQLDSALYVVGRQRADLGAYQNRLEHAVRAIDNAAENLQASESQIRDVDMAQEMVEFVKNQILSQSSSSMLAQANLRAQVVLRILG